MKWESIIHNNTSFSKKIHPMLSSHIKIHQYIRLELFRTVWQEKIPRLNIPLINPVAVSKFWETQIVLLRSIISAYGFWWDLDGF